MIRPLLLAALVLSATPALAAKSDGRDIGNVDTKWRMVWKDDSIQVSAFADPKIEGITCFLSRAVTGGAKGTFGIAEDTSDASVSCHQTGPITYKEAIKTGNDGEEVFNEKRSILFKSLHVMRFYDATTKSLVYLTYSDRVIEGSPKNSISAVTPMPWGTEVPGAPMLKK